MGFYNIGEVVPYLNLQRSRSTPFYIVTSAILVKHVTSIHTGTGLRTKTETYLNNVTAADDRQPSFQGKRLKIADPNFTHAISGDIVQDIVR